MLTPVRPDRSPMPLGFDLMSLILRRIFTLEPVGATEPILAWTAQSGRGRQDGSSRGTGAGRSRGNGSVAGRSDAHRVGRGRQYPGGYACLLLLTCARCWLTPRGRRPLAPPSGRA